MQRWARFEKIEVRLVITDSPARQVRFNYPIWLPKNLSPIRDYPIIRFLLKFIKAIQYFKKRFNVLKLFTMFLKGV